MLDNRYDIELQQGSTYELVLSIKDSEGNTKNVVGYSARMQMRSKYSSESAIIDLSSPDNGIQIYEGNAAVHITIDAANTANIYVAPSAKIPPFNKYVYDIEVVDNDGKVSKLVYGEATVYGEVTR